jgi:transposase
VRVVGLDIHRVFAEAVMLDDGKIVRLGRIGMTRDHLDAFARTLTHDDHVVVEATGNAAAVVEVILPHVGRVVVANPRQVRLIAHAKIKTDTIDATVLAKLHASNFLPEVWMPDPKTLALRRQVTRRNQIVRQRVRLKTITRSILHAHLLPQCPHADLFGTRGRNWLLAQLLPPDEREAVDRHLREYDRLGGDLRVVERELARDVSTAEEYRSAWRSKTGAAGGRHSSLATATAIRMALDGVARRRSAAAVCSAPNGSSRRSSPGCGRGV